VACLSIAQWRANTHRRSTSTTNLFGFDASYAALVTAYLNLVNFTGRFGWVFLSDRIGRRWVCACMCTQTG
jgi:MFS family permease